MFQVIPGPQQVDALGAIQVLGNLAQSWQRSQIDNQIAQANLQSVNLQNQLLSQYGGKNEDLKMQLYQQQIAESKQGIARSQQETSTSATQQALLQGEVGNLPLQRKQQELAISGEQQRQDTARALLPQQLRQNEMSLQLGSAELEGREISNTGQGIGNKIQELTLSDAQNMKALSKHILINEHGLDPFTANQLSGPGAFSMYQNAQKMKSKIHYQNAQTAAIEAATAAQKIDDPYRRLDLMGQMFQRMQGTDPDILKDVMSKADPDIRGIMQGVLDANVNPRTVKGMINKGLASDSADLQSAAAALQVYSDPNSIKERSQQILDPNSPTGMRILPSGVDNYKTAIQNMQKALLKAGAVKSTTQPTTAPSEEQDATDITLANLQEKRMASSAAESVANRLKATDARVTTIGLPDTPDTDAQDAMAIGTKTIPEEVMNDLPNYVKGDQLKTVKRVLKQVLPFSEVTKNNTFSYESDAQKRARFYEVVRQAFQTGRPETVFNTVWQKYGANGLFPEDQDVLNSLQQAMGWNIAPPKGK